MIIYVNKTKYNLDENTMKNNFVSSGYESQVYKYGDIVFKLYKEICLKYRLNEENVKYLSQIHTKRILLPKDVIYDENHEFFGYTMKYIKPEEKDDIKDLKLETLKKELLLIKKDLFLLREYNVFIDDLCDSNFIFSNGLYFIDSGSYEVNKARSKIYIEMMNREIMNDFIIKYILFRDYDITYEQKRKLLKIFSLDEYIDDILKKEKNSKLLINQYSKRIIDNL